MGSSDQPESWRCRTQRLTERDWYFTAEQPASARHLAHPEGCAALRIVPGLTNFSQAGMLGVRYTAVSLLALPRCG